MWHRNVGALLASLGLAVLSSVPAVPAGAAPSDAAHAFAINSFTTLTSDRNPTEFGGVVTFVARVVPAQPTAVGPAVTLSLPTGTVSFFDGSTSLGTAALDAEASATLTIASLTVGHHSVTAQYGGDATFGASTSIALDQVVVGLPTRTTLTAGPNPSTSGQTVTFTAAVTAVQLAVRTAFTPAGPSGSVIFLDGSATLGSAALGAQATARLTSSKLAVGHHAITARYSGNTIFAASTSSALDQVVAARATTLAVPQTPVASTPDCATQTMTVTLPRTAGVVYTVNGSLTLQPGESATITPSAARGYRLATGSHATRFTNTLDVAACSGQEPAMAVTGAVTTAQVLWALSLLALGALLTWLGRRRRA